MDDEYDPFKGDTGLKDDWDGVVISGEFVQQTGGNYALVLTNQADDGDMPEVRLGCGKGWTSYDGGETVEGASTKPRFHVMTAIQKFYTDAIAAGAGEELMKRNRELNNRGPFTAGLTVGMRFHWEVVNEPGQRNVDGVWTDVEGGIARLKVTKYLGTVDAPAAGHVQPSPSGAPSTTPASNGSSTSTEINPTDIQTLTQLAKSHPYGDFTDEVMSTKDSSGSVFLKNKPVMALLGDEAWYEGLRTS